MFEPLDRCRRDSTLFQFTSKQLRNFIDPDHLLIQIDERLDFPKPVAPLEERYCPDFGRSAIDPEVMVRALLVCSLYNIASFRRLCSAISENIAYQAVSERRILTGGKVNYGQSCSPEELRGVYQAFTSARTDIWRSAGIVGQVRFPPRKTSGAAVWHAIFDRGSAGVKGGDTGLLKK